jgi:hypothetical protein
MTETTIPLSHIQIWLTIFGLFITVSGMGAAAAWWGARLALKSFTGQLEALKEAAKKESEATDRRFQAVIDSQNERKLLMAELHKELQNRVMIARCYEDRSSCGDNRDSVVCGISKQVSALSAALDRQDEKRQAAVVENAKMFSDIQIQVALLTQTANELSKHSSSLERLILERQHDFRPPNGKDLLA